jgi:hypothetical protein
MIGGSIDNIIVEPSEKHLARILVAQIALAGFHPMRKEK